MNKYSLLLLTLLTSFFGLCQEKQLVVSTASMINDIAKNIGGELFEYKSIVPIGGDPHLYEPTPSDVALINGAVLIFRNGLTFEGWLNELIDNSGTGATSVLVTRGIDVIESQIYENATDPHAWMDASNGIIYASNIMKAFIELKPEQEAVFRQNYEVYSNELQQLDQYIVDRILEIPAEKRVLITSHDAFHYFGKRYKIRTESILGTSTDADAQTSDVIRLNKIIKENNIPAVFIESTVNPKLLQQLAHDNKIRIGGKLYADSLGEPDSPAGTYLKMLKFNADTIIDALSSEVEVVQGSKSNTSWLYILIGVVFIVGLVILVRNIS